MNIEALIARKLAEPFTHVVTTHYADGSTKDHSVRSIGGMETQIHLEEKKLGRDLIDRNTGKTVRVVKITTKAL